MLWDDQYLYIFAELKEEHIWGDLTERDAIIFYNNDFEIFIDPSGDTRNYGEIEINTLGTIFDLLLNKSYKVGGQGINWIGFATAQGVSDVDFPIYAGVYMPAL